MHTGEKKYSVYLEVPYFCVVNEKKKSLRVFSSLALPKPTSVLKSRRFATVPEKTGLCPVGPEDESLRAFSFFAA